MTIFCFNICWQIEKNIEQDLFRSAKIYKELITCFTYDHVWLLYSMFRIKDRNSLMRYLYDRKEKFEYDRHGLRLFDCYDIMVDIFWQSRSDVKINSVFNFNAKSATLLTLLRNVNIIFFSTLTMIGFTMNRSSRY